ncbi:restriction endonuclease subunit S [Streptomyces axinellae]|uniref:Type I restriction modification DNA specificity domain-containing protein n=1 Tax=Streptomyces axinellae TaxID=552788 RepID=A0ABN3Q0N1_9ACTN
MTGRQWQNLNIGQLGRVVTGSTPRTGDDGAWGDAIDFVTPTEMSYSNREPSECRKLSASGMEALKRRVIPAGSTLFACIGFSTGKVAQIFRPAITNQQVNALIPNSSVVDERFAYYLLRCKSADIRAIANGSTTPIVNKSMFQAVEVLLPYRQEQEAIADVLGALDDKIAINERIATTVDELAGILFRGCAERAPCVITDVASITMGQSPPGETYNEVGDGIPFYQGARDFGMRYPGHRVWCTAVARYAHENDVLVSVRAPVGEINVAAETCGIGRGVAAVRSDRYPHALLHALSSDKSAWQPYEAEGTVFGAINKTQFSQLELSWPSERHIDGLEAKLKALDERLRQATGESRSLAALRDTLLPQLMSGRLRVKDAEKIVEDHT